jgi:hypothetical protein
MVNKRTVQYQKPSNCRTRINIIIGIKETHVVAWIETFEIHLGSPNVSLSPPHLLYAVITVYSLVYWGPYNRRETEEATIILLRCY